MTTATTGPTADVREILDGQSRAYAARDVDGILTPYADGAVRYDLAPPLQQGAGTLVGDAQGVRAWLSGFTGPVLLEHDDVVVRVDATLAVVHALTRMTATPAGATDSFSFWFRSTLALSLVGRRWRIVHEHRSVPFHMDGSLRAAVDLEP
jgi:ketosteroid isomerase-like protein